MTAKFLSTCFCLAALILSTLAVGAAPKTGGYSGLEFLGSSLVSRLEIEKLLHLNQGAGLQNAGKALERLSAAFAKKSLKANLEIVPDSDGYYICVDVFDSRSSNALPTRKLEDMHHIRLPHEKPFALLAELKTRLEKLVEEGRQTSEKYEDGLRYYDDVAATRIAEKLVKELVGFKPYLLKILASDPNGERRADTVELLNWIPDAVDNCYQLIPALDDIDERVRMNAAKYIWARINLLPDNFPFEQLVEGFSRQLMRASHHDRIRALSALIELAKRDSDSITAIKTFDEARLKELQANSLIPSVKKAAFELLQVSANPPPLKRKYGSPDAGSSTGF